MPTEQLEGVGGYIFIISVRFCASAVTCPIRDGEPRQRSSKPLKVALMGICCRMRKVTRIGMTIGERRVLGVAGVHGHRWVQPSSVVRASINLPVSATTPSPLGRLAATGIAPEPLSRLGLAS